ncbi:MAG: NAD-dependent epimerase/dehydratase family protein [Thermodesulfovibrionales bacterium]
MKALVTGATGFIGHHVAKLLLEKGVPVRALVRAGGDSTALERLGAETAVGDVRDYGSLTRALKGCSHLFHLAADYRLWVPDPEVMYAINVGGTRNAITAALERGVERIVYTSTVGTLAASAEGTPADENTPVAFGDMVGHYKKSKYMAEKEVFASIERGAPVVVVHPSTPVGPLDRKPTPTGRMIVDFLNGRIPAYLDTGLNFVDVEDVAAGHWLACRYGKVGRRYILGNRNSTLRDFFGVLARLTGKRPPAVRLPYFPVLCAAFIDEAVSGALRGRHPRIPVTGVRMARKYMFFDSSRAVREIHLPQSPVEGALERAVRWFRENGYAAE